MWQDSWLSEKSLFYWRLYSGWRCRSLASSPRYFLSMETASCTTERSWGRSYSSSLSWQLPERKEGKTKEFHLLFVGCSSLLADSFGIACHLGVLTGLPCIGVAKNLLQVEGLANDELHKKQIQDLQAGGDAFPLTSTSGKILGMALRSCAKSTKPIYISVGHKISLLSAVRLVHSCCKYRIPEPIRQADIRSREYIWKHMEVNIAVPTPQPERGQDLESAGLEEADKD
ncbi:endonuclease V isoform X5 [Ahaetulla prasina]|uniref:endonuclease V isoform X5 n=1 Tax=Ahaetulla prasina TaxID=499056 RepID=UPI002647ADA2|nr:endonuclease V isoform X5 [Ahaetulla prasina]